jgi:hypothetical protein
MTDDKIAIDLTRIFTGEGPLKRTPEETAAWVKRHSEKGCCPEHDARR